MAAKKSLYEILEIPREASHGEIREAHDRLSQELDSRQAIMDRDDYVFQQRLLKAAFDTLANPMSRDAYDAQLINREIQAKPGLALVPVGSGHDAAKLKADALMLRAEAMALRADAMGLKADMATGLGSVGARGLATPVMQAAEPSMGGRFASSVRNVLLTLGTLVALGMVLKVAMLFWVTRPPGEASLAKKQTEEKVYLQEYYQAHGVRPATRAEADLLDAEERRKSLATTIRSDGDNEQRKAVQSEREFQAESRRRADQVTAELQFADQKAKQQRQEDESRERYQKEQDRRAAEYADRKREAEQEKWRRVLTTPGQRY